MDEKQPDTTPGVVIPSHLRAALRREVATFLLTRVGDALTIGGPKLARGDHQAHEDIACALGRLDVARDVLNHLGWMPGAHDRRDCLLPVDPDRLAFYVDEMRADAAEVLDDPSIYTDPAARIAEAHACLDLADVLDAA
jgi:hypothetical protein